MACSVGRRRLHSCCRHRLPGLIRVTIFALPHHRRRAAVTTGRHKLVVMSLSTPDDVVDLNVGGVFYTTTIKTLTHDADSLLAAMFSRLNVVDGADATSRPTQYNGRAFIDRDGVLFRYILDYLRNDGRILLPEGFQERRRLLQEAEYFRLTGLVCALRDGDRLSVGRSTSPVKLSSVSAAERGHIIVGYRGTFALGRDGGGGVADVKFRKLWRILVSGRVSLCRQVFGDTLNDSRDPNRGADDTDRYSARYFLKHSFIEQAFDALLDAGFRMVGACASSTNSAGGELKPGTDVEESRWNHYNEFVFVRP